jgi:hypothetical protein
MNAEERNRRLKYGTAVPRSWIPDFNMTHRRGADPNAMSDYYAFKRRLRLSSQRSRVSRLNKDIRLVQMLFAISLIVIGVLVGGPLGLLVGSCVALAFLFLRIEF